jgi:hypothetical protein
MVRPLLTFSCSCRAPRPRSAGRPIVPPAAPARAPSCREGVSLWATGPFLWNALCTDSRPRPPSGWLGANASSTVFRGRPHVVHGSIHSLTDPRDLGRLIHNCLVTQGENGGCRGREGPVGGGAVDNGRLRGYPQLRGAGGPCTACGEMVVHSRRFLWITPPGTTRPDAPWGAPEGVRGASAEVRTGPRRAGGRGPRWPGRFDRRPGSPYGRYA